VARKKELADRNKSALTHKVTLAARLWLENHGFKPVESEVWMPPTDTKEKGWIADLAGVIAPTQTELIEMKMVPRPPRWNYGGNNDHYEPRRYEWEQLYKPLDRLMTCLVEVKTSRADFRADRKWKMTPPTDLAWVAMPPGIVKKEEWPDGWGILELHGNVVAQLRTPTARVALDSQRFDVVYQLALACDHRVRRASIRQAEKRFVIEDSKRISIDRLDKVISAVHDIAAGHLRWREEPLKSVEQALRHHGIRNARASEIERLAKLFKIAAHVESGS
jgi:hypothetical protein